MQNVQILRKSTACK